MKLIKNDDRLSYARISACKFMHWTLMIKTEPLVVERGITLMRRNWQDKTAYHLSQHL